MLQSSYIEHQNNILIVDDEINVCKGCQRIFEEEGFLTNYALTGEEGLEKATHNNFDLIITDMKMPDINGMEVIKRIKQRQPDMPVIMITGYASVPTAVEAMKIGADDYIPKPFKPDEILNAVHKAISKVNEDTIVYQKENLINKSKIYDKIIEKEQVLSVLSRTKKDYDFWKTLFAKGSDALEEYDLSYEAKAAIVSGDIKWIKNHYPWASDELTDDKLEFLKYRLEAERW